ncbi:MAG: 3-isopropylmalate dehydratase large subunit [Methylocystaceae bacterium]|nr:3-isopropylmalate dehydratase large subunit [Methylocystaceae bacterium]
MKRPQTLFDKVWQAHEITRDETGQSLLWVDRHFVHEGSFHAFAKLAERDLKVAHPEQTWGIADHYVPTRSRSLDDVSDKIASVIRLLQDNTKKHDIELIGLDSVHQGIVHVVGPELGLTQPGLLMVCGDSHTATHGALGAIAFGIGASEVAHVLATQTIWQTKPKQLRITFEGDLPLGVTAKDMALHWISQYGADAARGCAIEYAGKAVRDLSVEGRMTLCNLSIEAGGRIGMIAPDKKTIDFCSSRERSPKDEALVHAQTYWNELKTDVGAAFDREIVIDASQIAPTVTWGVSPEEALPIDAHCPDPKEIDEPNKARQIKDSLAYMGLSDGQAIEDITIDRVFIGSCTNSRIEDLRSAAEVLKGRKSLVPGIVSPGSTQIKTQAENEGLDQIFIDAGLDWVESGCSMCVGMNGDLVASGERCASTSNRNFKGRQGPGSRTHLMSPAMVSWAAVHGKLADIRTFKREGEN